MAYQGVRRKVFISHYHGDSVEVNAFIEKFANQEKVFIPKVLGANDNDDFINSNDPEYVMRRIRDLYLQDSTVTIALLGSCTHSRRYVDWELKSSLRQGAYTPNGVMGIVLPSQNNNAHLPPRLKENWVEGHTGGYARYWSYPTSANQLGNWIEDAFTARAQRTHLIQNSQDMMKYNRSCNVCSLTH